MSRQTDVAREADVSALIAKVVAQYGRIDVLVNNAGIEFAKTVVDTTVEEWDRLFAVNVRGMFLCSRACIPVMAAAGSGVIVNVASELGLVGKANVATYAHRRAAW